MDSISLFSGIRKERDAWRKMAKRLFIKYLDQKKRAEYYKSILFDLTTKEN